MTWKDKTTIEAVQKYMRMFVGLVFFALLMWMLASQRVDIDTVVKVLLGTLTGHMFGQAAVQSKQP